MAGLGLLAGSSPQVDAYRRAFPDCRAKGDASGRPMAGAKQTRVDAGLNQGMGVGDQENKGRVHENLYRVRTAGAMAARRKAAVGQKAQVGGIPLDGGVMTSVGLKKQCQRCSRPQAQA